MIARSKMPSLLYITFDNVGVGRLMGKTMVEKGRADGQFAIIKGDPGDPNATFLFNGMMESLKPLVDSGKITIACETFHGKLEARQRSEEHGAMPDQNR